MPSIEQQVIAAEKDIAESRGWIFRAARNLRELQPGFSSTTPGNGSPGGGSSVTIGSSVERAALASTGEPDPAVWALEQLTKVAARIAADAHFLRSLATTFGYPTPGDRDPNPANRGRATESVSNAMRWCWNCERLRDDEGRAHACLVYRTVEVAKPAPAGNNTAKALEPVTIGLCRFCYDHRDPITNDPPELHLVELHHNGWTVTTAIAKNLRKREAEQPTLDQAEADRLERIAAMRPPPEDETKKEAKKRAAIRAQRRRRVST